MSGHNYTIDQANEVTPPRIVYSQKSAGDALSTSIRAEGQVIALTVDGTSRAYDLTALLWEGLKAAKAANFDKIFVSLQCEGSDVYFLFDQEPASFGNSIDDTLTIAAAGTLAFTSGITANVPAAKAYPPAHLPAGMTSWDFTLTDQIDRTIHLKCKGSGTSTLRIWCSSPLQPGAT